MSPSRLAVVSLLFLFLSGCPKAIPVPVDPPEARVDYALTPLDTPVTLAPLLNDFDPTGEVISVVSIGTPSHGTAVLNGDGTVDYTPDLGYLGGDQFTVTVVDESGWEASNEAYVTVGPTQRLAFRSNYTDYFTFQLYMMDTAHPLGMVPIGERFRITAGPAISHTQVSSYIPTADGKNMIYLADDNEQFGIIDLFHVDLDQLGVATRLTELQSGQAIGGLSLPELAPDNLHAYYLSNQLNTGTPDENLFDIVQVEIANPANKVRVNTPINTHTTPVQDDQIERFAVSPDSGYVVYVVNDADAQGPDVALAELRVVDLTNPGVSTVISGTPTAGTFGVIGSLSSLGFRFVPGTTKVVYASKENGSTTIDLYMVDYINPTTPVKLSGNCVGTGVLNFGFTPDGTRIVYVSQEDIEGVQHLYSVEIANPGVSTRLSQARFDAATIGAFSIGQDSSFAIYTRDDDTPGIRELYFVDFSKPTVQTKLNDTLRAAGEDPLTEPAELVQGVRVSAGMPRRVLFSTNEVPVGGVPYQSFHVVDVDEPGVVIDVGPAKTFAGHAFGLMPDGDTVIYQDSAPEHIQATTLNMFRIGAPTVLTRLTPEDNGGDVAAEFSFFP